MLNVQKIKPDMKVLDTTGHHIGVVDHVDEDGVGLKREGFADNLHHFAPLAAVVKVEEGTVVIETGHVTSIEAVEGAILYALTVGVVLAAARRARDIMRRGGLFLVGVGIFTIASVAAGLAPNAQWLNTARFCKWLVCKQYNGRPIFDG